MPTLINAEGTGQKLTNMYFQGKKYSKQGRFSGKKRSKDTDKDREKDIAYIPWEGMTFFGESCDVWFYCRVPFILLTSTYYVIR